ncbi:hypothetical protein RRF57_007017 [Xylaria bambusicola]|uniref:Uncharacterized protein n=1 Tax=Xylaria bambusicola TaxID=326684 RepID=A0AAN7UKB6_9PEZI
MSKGTAEKHRNPVSPLHAGCMRLRQYNVPRQAGGLKKNPGHLSVSHKTSPSNELRLLDPSAKLIVSVMQSAAIIADGSKRLTTGLLGCALLTQADEYYPSCLIGSEMGRQFSL